MIKETVLSRSVRVMFAGGMAMGLGLLATPALAQEMQRVEITGSSVKRVDSETALPVQVISKQEIARTGATSTEELLTSISALSSAGSTNGASGAGNSTYGLSTISLRGLGAERTLVLVNGRRLAAFAGGGGAAVNVNVIPLAAIERVEVLKDGASGVYGSDAMGGVVNFILSRQFKGVEIAAGAGSPTAKGGGQNKKASITGGFGDLDEDRYSVVLSASFEKEKALFASQRSYAGTSINRPYFFGGATGQGNIEGGIVTSGPNRGELLPGFGKSPATGFGNPLAASGNCGAINMVAASGLTKHGDKYCVFDGAPYVSVIPDRQLGNLTGNFTFKLNENHQLFADALYSRSTVDSTIQANPVRYSFLSDDVEFAKQNQLPALILQPSNPNYQSIAVPYLQSRGYTSLIGQPLAITARVFDYGNRKSHDVATQSRLVVGAKGTIANQDYEIALASNESKLSGSVPQGYFAQSAYAKIINASNDWNPWAVGGVQTGALAEQLKAAAYSGGTLNAKSKSTNFDSKITGDAFKLNNLTSQYAAGFQSRRETYVTDPSAALESGDISGLGGSVPPVNRGRTVNSVFGELNLPLLKTLEANVALRNDRYSDVGSSTNYKASARWQPSKTVLLRGSLGSGFRAPTLTDMWTPQAVETSSTFDDPKTNQKDVQVSQLSGGNPNLQAEKSKQGSIGLVLSPTNKINLSLDFYQIKVSNIISTPSAQEVVSGALAGDPAYVNLVKRDSNDNIELLTVIKGNNGQATINGFDAFAGWRDSFSFGKLDVSLNGTYTNKYDQTSPGGVTFHKVGTLVDGNGGTVIGADKGGVVLRWKHVLSATWSSGPWATTVVQNFRTGYETKRDLNNNRHFVPSEAIYDANLSYKGIKNVTLAAGLRNVFDKKPPLYIPVSGQFQYGYDISQYDPRGRFAYVSGSYAFK